MTKLKRNGQKNFAHEVVGEDKHERIHIWNLEFGGDKHLEFGGDKHEKIHIWNDSL